MFEQSYVHKDNPRAHYMGARFTEEEGDFIKKCADKRKNSVSDLFRMAVKTELKEEIQLNESKEQSCKECTFFDDDAQMGDSHCKLKGSICISGEEFKKKEQKIPETKEIVSKIFYILPECEYYQEDGNCKCCSSENYKYGCNEMWCDKKVEYELNRNVLETNEVD